MAKTESKHGSFKFIFTFGLINLIFEINYYKKKINTKLS